MDHVRYRVGEDMGFILTPRGRKILDRNFSQISQLPAFKLQYVSQCYTVSNGAASGLKDVGLMFWRRARGTGEFRSRGWLDARCTSVGVPHSGDWDLTDACRVPAGGAGSQL